MKYRVFLVEDEPHTRELLGKTVSAHPELTVAAAVGNYTDAMNQMADILDSHVLLVDLGLPDGDGSDIIRYVSHADDPPNILVISVFGDERHVVRAIEAGAEVLHPPQEWPEYHDHYFGVFVRDPDGNNVEAVCHAPA